MSYILHIYCMLLQKLWLSSFSTEYICVLLASPFFCVLLAPKGLIYVFLNSWCKQMQYMRPCETPPKSICPLQLFQATERGVCMSLYVWM